LREIERETYGISHQHKFETCRATVVGPMQNSVRKGTNMPEIPSQLYDITERLGRNERLRRRTVETLLKWFGAGRRGSAVVANLRAALDFVGLETDPDFTEGSVDDFITFRLIESASRTASSTEEHDSHEPVQVEIKPRSAAEEKVVQTSAPSDDFLEPEFDDGPPAADDDRPVVSKPADWTITALRERWEDGKRDLQPHFQREYVWRLKPELPSRLIEVGKHMVMLDRATRVRA
jgi:hypothetical protein